MITVSGVTNSTNTQLGISKNNAVNFKSNEIKADSVELRNKKNNTKTILEIIGVSTVTIIGTILAIKHFYPKNIKTIVEKVANDIKEPKNTVSTTSTLIKTVSKDIPIKEKEIGKQSAPKTNTNSKKIAGKFFEDEILKFITPEELANLNKDVLFKSGVITPEMSLMFAQIRNLKGEEFIKTSYKLMTRLLGCEDYAPELILKNTDEYKGAFDKFSGKIKIAINNCRSGTELQGDLLAILRHELEHFIQYTDIARTEGLGIDAICKANAKSGLRALKMDRERCIKIYHKPFEEMTESEDEILQNFYNRSKAEINTTFYEKVIQKKGIIKKGTPEFNKATEYLKAEEVYTYVKYKEKNDLLVKDYENNLLEQEANNVGTPMDMNFGFFKSALKNPIT